MARMLYGRTDTDFEFYCRACIDDLKNPAAAVCFLRTEHRRLVHGVRGVCLDLLREPQSLIICELLPRADSASRYKLYILRLDCAEACLNTPQLQLSAGRCSHLVQSVVSSTMQASVGRTFAVRGPAATPRLR